MPDLITQDELEQFLQVDFTDPSDAAVAQWISAASQVVQTWCGVTLAAVSGVVETFDGGTTSLFVTKAMPIRAVNSITEDGQLLTAADYIWYPNGTITRMSGDYASRWKYKRQGVVVDYDGGYTQIPDDLKMVTARVVGRLFAEGAAYAATTPGVKSVTIEDQTVAYGDPNRRQLGGFEVLTAADRMVLAKYRRTL